MSCSSAPRVSNAAPPTVICGTTLSHSAAGAVVSNATAGDVTVTSVTVGDLIFLHLASGCHTGADSVSVVTVKLTIVAPSGPTSSPISP